MNKEINIIIFLWVFIVLFLGYFFYYQWYDYKRTPPDDCLPGSKQYCIFDNDSIGQGLGSNDSNSSLIILSSEYAYSESFSGFLRSCGYRGLRF